MRFGGAQLVAARKLIQISVNRPSRAAKMTDQHQLNRTGPPTNPRARRVHFPLFLQRAVHGHNSQRSRSFGSWAHERRPLLRSGYNLGGRGRVFDTFEREDETRITCTPMRTLVAFLVLFGLIGVCVAAVFLGVGSKKPY